METFKNPGLVLQLVKNMRKGESAARDERATQQRDGANDNASAIVNPALEEQKTIITDEVKNLVAEVETNESSKKSSGALTKLKKLFSKKETAFDESRRNFLKKAAAIVGGIAVGGPTALAKASEEENTLPVDPNNSTVETNGTHEISFTPPEFDYDSLTPEKKEAILKKRKMHIVVVTTEEAKAEVESIGGDFKAGSEKIAQYSQEFFTNSGADIQFDVQCDDVEVDVIVIPKSEYADESGQTSETAAEYLNTNLNAGSYLNDQFSTLAAAKGIPRDKLCPFMYVKNNSAAGFANPAGPGIVLDAESMLHPTKNDQQQREIGPHEFAQKFLDEHSGVDNGSLRHGFKYEVPMENGKLKYDFRESTSDGLAITEITTPSFSVKAGRRRIPHTSYNGKFVKLFDHNSQTYIEVPLGDATSDAWHHGTWEELDKYTHERVEDTQAPELLAEGGMSPTGVLPENDTTFDLKMNFNEDVQKGEGKIRLYGTYTGEGVDWGTQDYYEFDANDLVIEGSNVAIPVSVNKFTEYYVNVDEGAIKDAAGNNFAGISDNSTWTFETKDFATGVNDIENGKLFNIRVNHSSQKIEMDNIDQVKVARIYNMNGQLVKMENDPRGPIDINDLKTGIYIVQVFDRQGRREAVKVGINKSWR